MNITISQLVQNGRMTFVEFMAAARSNGENPALWLREKHNGRINTYFEGGVHYVEAVQTQPEGV